MAANNKTQNSLATAEIPSSFFWDEVNFDNPNAPPSDAPPLGVLELFEGEFHGTGFNTIFRPNSGPPNGTSFPNPVSPPPPTPPSENVLELNLTRETLCFSAPVGNIPNRGLEQQAGIFLNARDYKQVVFDVANPTTGLPDGKFTGIHHEVGQWIHVPATTVDPVLGISLVRMACIPHGTTIQAQCLEPTKSHAGPPTFAKVDITPIVIGSNPPKPITFASQTASNNSTPRLPQDLTKFIDAGTITQEMLDDPNTVLRNAITGQKITQTTVFTVITNPANPELGGGTRNIAFLLGSGGTETTAPRANAAAVGMQATFWIERVEQDIEIPVFKLGQLPMEVFPPASTAGGIAPRFIIDPPFSIPEPRTITVSSTQIQYSQKVTLNFAGLEWPHVSCATLVPKAAQRVPASAFK
jgi:hypothetical protein